MYTKWRLCLHNPCEVAYKSKPDNIKNANSYLNSEVSGWVLEITQHNILFKLGQHLLEQNTNFLHTKIN